MRLFGKIVVGSAALLYWSVAARGAVEYRITTLDVLPGGMDSRPTDINEHGIIVGHSTLDRSGHVGRSRPVMWDSAGRPTELWSDDFDLETLTDNIGMSNPTWADGDLNEDGAVALADLDLMFAQYGLDLEVVS